MNKKKVIIIGAGIGGLATAIQLARQGLEVTILEKNSHPGGRCQQLIRDGHIFDTGPTMFIFPQIYSDFFKSIDEDLNKYLKLIKTDPIYQLNFSDGTTLTLTNNLEKMQNQLEKIESGSFNKFLSYLNGGKNHYNFAKKQLIYRSFERPWEYFNLKNFYLILKHQALKSHYGYTSSFFKHPHLRSAFTFQDSYLSLHPFNSLAIFSMFTYTEIIEGNYLPRGGMYQIILALVQIAKKYKVKINYQSPVEKINIARNQATGVTLENKTIKNADYIIVNANLSYAYEKLLPEDSHAKKLSKRKYSSSAIVFHWGLDKTYPQLKTHNLFFSDNYKAGFDQVLNQPTPPPNPHFYIQAPTRTDSSRAPKNQDTLSIMVPINRIYPSHPVDWGKYKEDVRKYIIDRLHKSGLKDVEKHIKFEICYTPKDWQSYLNLTYGSVYGLHHNLTQLGYLRENRQHKKHKNVFFVGASNHPGSGLPTVLLCSQFTSQKVIKTLKLSK